MPIRCPTPSHRLTGLLHFTRPPRLDALSRTLHVTPCFSTRTLTPDTGYVPVIGLEIHARLLTRSKLFSRSPYEFAAPPNTQIALLDAAIPGSMPLLNRRCVELALRIALALDARVNLISQFDRKHYFYADSPAGYQITQYWKPIAEGGCLDYIWPVDTLAEGAPHPLATTRVEDSTGGAHLLSRARFKQIQIEQDTGKSLHDLRQGQTYIDLNRAGVGLLELVTEPDFSHPKQAAFFVSELANLLALLDCSSVNASQGDLRVDVNVSVGPSFTSQGPRTEVKNVNSIRAISRAIQFEIDRQIGVLQSGGAVINETRSYDPEREITLPMRDKETIQDYRYMPEPDLLPLRLNATCENCDASANHPPSPTPQSSSRFRTNPQLCVQCAARSLDALVRAKSSGELPHRMRRRLVLDHAVHWEKAAVLVEYPQLCALYDRCHELLCGVGGAGNNSAADSNLMSISQSSISRELTYWLAGKLFGMLKRGALPSLPTPERLSEFVRLTLSGKIYGKDSEELLDLITTADPSVANVSCYELADRRGWLLITDPVRIRAGCEQVIRDHPKYIKQYNDGKRKKAIKRFAQRLTSDSSYAAEKFSPYMVEQLLTEILEQLAQDKTKSVSDA